MICLDAIKRKMFHTKKEERAEDITEQDNRKKK